MARVAVGADDGGRPTGRRRNRFPADRTSRWVTRAAVALIVVQTLVRGWTCLRGYFYLDDIAFTGRSVDYPLWSLTYLTTPYNSHVMPGSFVWVWLTTRVFPLQWTPVALVMIALQVVLSVLVYRLLVDLFGRRPAILPPLALALLSPVSLPAFEWWAAALNQLPMQIALVSALLLQVRYLRSGRRSLGLAGVGALAVGLLFSEKTLFVVPLVTAVTLAYLTTGTLWARLRRSLRRDLLVWSGYALVSVPYLAYYVLDVPSPLRPVAAGHDIADLATQSIFRATIPGLLGGPWHWVRIGSAGALADPDAFFVVAASLVAAAVVAATLVLWRRSGAAWVILLGYVALSLGLLARSRATLVGPVVGTEYRYQTDVALVAALALALATMPVLGPFRRGDAVLLEPRVGARRWLATHILGPLSEAGAAPAHPVEASRLTAVVGASLLTASALWSTAAYDPLWVDNPARPYVTTATSGIASLPPGVLVGNVSAPTEVAWPLLYPYNQTYRLLGPVLPVSRRLSAGQTTSELVVPDEHGLFRQAGVVGPRALPGPVAGCGWSLGTGSLDIPLTATATDAVAVVRIAYDAGRSDTLAVLVGARRVTVPFTAGRGVVYLAAEGPFASIHVESGPEGTHICSDDITAGVPVPVPGTVP